MSNAISSWSFHRALHEEKVLPAECVKAEMLTEIDGVLQMRYTVNVTADDAKKISRAWAKAFLQPPY